MECHYSITSPLVACRLLLILLSSIVSVVDASFTTATAGGGCLSSHCVRTTGLPGRRTFTTTTTSLGEGLVEEYLTTNDDDNTPNTRRDYHPAEDAGNSESALTTAQIDGLLSQRLRFKKARDFAQADVILRGLNEAGVFVHDKRREWRADGRHDFGRRPTGRRRGGVGSLSAEDIADVEALLELRKEAKRGKEYHKVDYITDMLKTKHGVRVNDKKKEWSVVGDDCYVPSPVAPSTDPTHTMAADLKDRIKQRLGDRAAARKRKEYSLADTILDELMEEPYSVVVDDLNKEWKVVDKNDMDWFVREAQASQRSAFVREQQGRHHEENSLAAAFLKAMSDDDEERGDRIVAAAVVSDDVVAATASETNEVVVATGVDAVTPESVTIVKDDDEDALQTSAEADDTIVAANTDESADLASLTVVLLKEKLRVVGLPVSGRKAELIERLVKNNYS